MSPKSQLRLAWKKRLSEVSMERRDEAAKALANYLFPQGVIASFASFQNEINTNLLNRRLAREKRLALPCVEGEALTFYIVYNLETELSLRSMGILEPVQSLCKKAEHIDIVLVPGLAFDSQYHRLGYGKGYYDRWLAQHQVFSIGIGYREQKAERVPVDSHDVELNQLLLL